MAKKYLTRRQLQERYGDKSHMFIEDLLRKDATFPRPIKPGGSESSHRLWDEEELQSWERTRVSGSRVPRMVKTLDGTSVPLAEIVSMDDGGPRERVVATLKSGKKVELQAKSLNEVTAA